MPAAEIHDPGPASPGRALLVALAEGGLLAGCATLKARVLLADTPLSTPHSQLANALLILSVGCTFIALPTRWRRSVLLAFTMALSAVLVVDQVHYRAFREFFSVRELGHAGQLISVFASILPYLQWSDLWFLADWPAWFWLARRRSALLSGLSGPTRRITAVIAGAVSLTLGAFVTWDYVMAPRPGRILVTNRPFAVREIGVFGFHLFDCIDLVRSQPAPRLVRPADRQYVQQWFAARPRPDPAADAVPFGAARGANLIFLQLESFEAFVLGLTVNGHEITPRLNRLRDDSWHFRRFFPQSGVGTTSDAEFCALNSLLPALDDVVARRDAWNTFRALPALLAEQGYQTMAMSVCRPDLWNMGWMHRQYGFKQCYYYDAFRTRQEDPLKITDDRFLARARDILRASPQPFFAHLMTITTHAPFSYLPADWKKIDLGVWQRGVLGDYLQAAHFVDHTVGQFLDGLRADGLLDRTVIFIYGDHEALPPDARWNARALETDRIGSRLDEFLRRRVPLLIRIPSQARGVTLDRLGGQVDLTPTAMHLLGIADDRTFHLGQNLFRGTNAFICFRSGAFAFDGYFFNSPDGLLSSGGCEPIQPGATVDPKDCENSWRQAQEHLHVSDLILEQNMLPDLEAGGR